MFISKTIKNRLTKYRRRLLLGSVLLGLSFVGGFNAQAEEQDGPIALSLETVILFALNDDPDIGK